MPRSGSYKWTKKDPIETNRRNVLKKGVATIGIASFGYTTINRSKARSTELSLGDKPFIEVGIKYHISNDQSMGNTDGLPKYLIDEEDSIIGFMQHQGFEGFTDAESIITDGQSFYFDTPSTIYGNKTPTIDTTFDFNKGTGKFLTLSEEIQQPAVRVNSLEENTLQGEVSSNHFTVQPNEVESIRLSERKVNIPKEYVADPEPGKVITEAIEIRPEIKIRNNGLMSLFGSNDTYVIPISSKNQMAKNIYETRVTESESVIRNTGDKELLIVQNGVTNDE